MNSKTRVSQQRHRMNRVLNYAYSNITDDIDLETLADVACLSKYHFARSFSEHFHETPVQLVWRLRMEYAARNLLYLPYQSITQVALDSGFSSPQSFNQIFKKRYNLSPTSFKKRTLEKRETLSVAGKSDHWPKVVMPNANRDLFVRIEHRPEYRVAYVRHVGPYIGEYCRIGDVYNLLYGWARSRNLMNDDVIGISICPDNSVFTPAGRCVYDAGILVPNDFPEDDIVSIQTIPAGTYAVLSVTCPDHEMEDVWEWLTTVWLPKSGRFREVFPSYEYYPPSSGQGISAKNGVELCMRLLRS